MGLTEFLYFEAALIIGVLATVGVGVLALPAAYFRAARWCFITAAIGFAGLGIMWGWTTTESLLIRVLITGSLGFIAAAGLTEALRLTNALEAKARQQEHSAAAVQPKPMALAPEITIPKLEDLFKSDFDFLSLDRILSMKIEIPSISFEKTIDIKLKIWRDFGSNTEFVSAYIPIFDDARMSNNSIEDVVEHMRDHIKQWRQDAKSISVATGFAGSLTRSEDLVFSGRVFVYTMNTMDAIQMGHLVESYRKDGMFLEIRGSDYLFFKSKG